MPSLNDAMSDVKEQIMETKKTDYYNALVGVARGIAANAKPYYTQEEQEAVIMACGSAFIVAYPEIAGAMSIREDGN